MNTWHLSAAASLALGSFSPTFAEAELPDIFAPVIEQARADCAALENGEFALGDGAVTRGVDLGEGVQADVLDAFGFACSTAASMYCGTGGCDSYFAVDGRLYTFINQGWELIDFGESRVLLLGVHGSQCGGYGFQPCVRGLIWSEGAFLTPTRRE